MNDPTNSRYRYLSFRGNEMYRRFITDNQEIVSNKPANKENIVPPHGTYGELLFRPEWKAKRKEIIERDKCCVVCESSEVLQVHHRQYHFIVRENRFKMPWDYANNLLITLCEQCHRRGHGKYKVPTINI